MAGISSFKDLKLNKQLLLAVDEAGFEHPTLIQQKAIPPVLGGQHVVGIAQTGTGKTAAYVLPLLKILGHAGETSPRAMILLPTRELAIQVGDCVKQFALHTGLRSVVLYGGTGTRMQKQLLDQGADIIVGTPGRILELYSDGSLIVKKIKHLVIDEADKMMDMGFMPQLNRLLEILPSKKQFLLFSATMHPRVQKLAEHFIDFPHYIHIHPEQKTAATVSQTVYQVPNFGTKLNLLRYLLDHDGRIVKAIIFCKTRKSAQQVFDFLTLVYGNENVRLIHSNKQQTTRIHAMNEFRNEAVRLLVATDVSARGLDVAGISHVINFEVPLVYDDYVHRIGRTGRASRTGSSITFCNPAETFHLKKIEKLISQRLPVVEIPGEVALETTPHEEKQAMLREADLLRQKEDPGYRGAFHKKKK